MAFTLEQRQAEIAKVLDQVDRKRALLAARLRAGEVDIEAARVGNAQMPVGARWAEFIELPLAPVCRNPGFAVCLGSRCCSVRLS